MPIRGGCPLKGYLRVGISLVEVFERVGKSVILVSKKGPKGLPITFYGFENVEKTFWICDLFIYKGQCIYRT